MGLLDGLSQFFRGGSTTVSARESPGLPARTLQQWRPSLPHEAADYAALWRQAIAPTHPILLERIAMRLAGGDQDSRRVHRDPALKARVAALEPDDAAALAVEAFERVPFLSRLAHLISYSAYSQRLDPATYGISPDAEWIAYDMSDLGECALPRAGVLSEAQMERLAWAVGHVVERGESNVITLERNLSGLAPLVLGDASVPLSPLGQAALERLYCRLDEGPRATTYRDSHEALIASLGERLGRAPGDSVYFSAKQQLASTASRCRAQLEAVAGPDVAPFVRAIYAGTQRFDRKFQAGWPEVEAFEGLTPERRAAALLRCLRAIFAVSVQEEQGRRERPQPIPYFGDRPAEALVDQLDAGPDRRPSYLRDALGSLFERFIGRKVAFSDGDLAEVAGFITDHRVRGAARSLHVVKHIEKRLADGASPAFVEKIEAVLAALRGDSNVYVDTFDRATVPRLAQALEAAAVKGEVGDGRAANGETTKRGVAAAAALGPWDTDTLAPPTQELLVPHYAHAVLAFYEDVADQRKFTPEHVAFIDRLIAYDAGDLEAAPPNPHPRGTVQSKIFLMSLAQHRPRAYASTLAPLRARVVLIGALPAAYRAAFVRLAGETHLLEGKSSPSKKWLDAARPALGDLTDAERLGLLETLLEAHEPAGSTFDTAMRGLIYLSAAWTPARVGPLLVAYARKTCFQTVPGFGIRSERHGNACLWALIHMPDGAGVPFLARLHQRVKYPSVKKKIDAALNEAARAAGLSRGALDEVSTPTHDLVDGAREIAVGAGAALLRVVGTASVEIRWRSPEGRVSASVPAALKAAKAEIKAARDAAKEIEADRSLQVARLQRLYLENRTWRLTEWRERYAEHPLVGGLARRLIWTVVEGDTRVSVSLVDDALVDRDGRTVVAGENATIALWHPLGSPTAETLAWRARLAALGIVQPFKQAHREVYVVTDAERTTGTYSNRFAGHILKQHQMMSLARLKGWRVTHRIWADVPNDEPTHLVLAEHGLVAEFWTVGAGGDDPEVTHSNAYSYLSTDQVRFYRIADMAELAKPTNAYGPRRGDVVAMADVPPIVFSEVMRTCDLFTGVASVANDPDWVNAGADVQHPSQWRRTIGERYWRLQSFGDLGEAAKMRAETLAGIVPALAVADRLALDGKFLAVRGKLRSYKIHIGSGNILMEPDDRYLCIVTGAGDARDADVPLPFEGDTMLSIILSKALLLIDDDKVKDPSIARQIRGAA